MKYPAALVLMAGLALGVAACDDTTCSETAMRSGTPDAESACISAVNRNRPSANATVTNSDFSAAGTTVMLTSSDGDNWRCLASNDGIVEGLSIVE
ncbi:MAG TPA: hypothetical protein PKA33_06240 [Amaricoccus sp.]|uniref:hypothetical protein n=1 Tax=Amaricoccus sp. TaxID=1872485 RepID=UPI002B7C3700|nr:hypothetical protein [Amaricoccus sp.]HMQ94960.1 hypothetical protein [Amaricoccus sp.]HMR53326.1 hypothetical protein [Amaricoccus sp.]HMT98958.1 hypothetical protein [Amaricoccus sp.]